MKPQNIEAIYGLSPLQEGILFHALYDSDSAEYFEQFSFPLEGDLDVEAFEAAWQKVVARHPVLRTAFVWEGLEKPRQVVHRQVTLPFERLDWSDLDEDERGRRLKALLDEDRRQGFVLARAPLMRVILVRLGESRHQMVWSHHHLLLDGWSVSLVVGEVFASYRAARLNLSLGLPPVRAYRDYIRFLDSRRRETSASARDVESFWRRLFEDWQPMDTGLARPATSSSELSEEASHG